jgi:hypothetical protein
MAMNFDAVLRISAKVLGVEELSKLEKGLAGTEKGAKDVKSAFDAVAGSAIWQAAAAGAALFTAGIGLAVKAAIDFESSMADVRKVVDGLESPEAFREMQHEILELSNTMPIAASGFAEIYAAAGQSGVAKDDLREFAIAVAQTAVAFDMTAEQAGRAMAQMRSALGLTTPELVLLTDAINELSNDSRGALTAGDLVEFMTRVGAFGKLAGLSAEQTAAFGAAMIQTGVQTNVAATSFRNMVSALSKGPSMTDKQVDALRRLGYSMADAKQIESELTRAAETESRRRVDDARRHKDDIVRLAQEQSDRRIEVARDETDRLSKEINRRFRDELTVLQDGWEDQAKAQEDAMRDRANAQIKALQRQERNEIDSIQKVAREQKTDATATVDRIRDAYEARIDAIRDQLDRELTVQRRAQRNQQTVIRDQLDDRKDLELKANSERFKLVEKQEKSFMDGQKDAAEGRFKAIEEAEKQFVENAKANAKKTGEELATASKQGFADRLQADAMGTIREVLERIRNVPESQKISVISDLFGDETRGLPPMIANLDELDRLLNMVGDSTGYAGSVAKEYALRVTTASAQIQVFWNKLTNVAILIGTTVLPYISQLTEAFSPLLDAVANFAKANPGFVAAAVAIGGVASAIILALPFIAAGIVLIAQAKVALATLAPAFLAIKGAIGVFVGAFKFAFLSGLIPLLKGVVAWVGATFIPALLAFFSGPVGWTVLAVAAVVAMAVAFREPIMNFLGWLGGALAGGLKTVAEWTLKIPEYMVKAWTAARDAIRSFFVWFAGAITDGIKALWAIGEPIRKFWAGVWDGVKPYVTGYFNFLRGVFDWGLKAAWAVVDTLLIQPWIGLWRTLSGAADNFRDYLRVNVFQPLGQAFDERVQVLEVRWSRFTSELSRLMDSARQIISGIWDGLAQRFNDRVEVLSGRWTWLTTKFSELMDGARQKVAAIWEGMGQAFNQYISTPISDAWQKVIDFLPWVMQKAADLVGGIWTGMIESIKSAVRGMLQYIASTINTVAGLINRLIKAFNALPGADIPEIPTISVPAFAKGGTVDRPTLAMVGEGSEREYIIPESKMQAASSRFLGGARGAAVIPSTAGGGSAGSSTGKLTLNITTGPVMQQQDGSRWVSMDDFERGLQQVSAQLFDDLRRPESRLALGAL